MPGLRAALMVLALGCVAAASATPTQVYVSIKGTVWSRFPCVINSGRPITASFGDVQSNEIDGVYKTITIEYSLDCSRSTTNEVRMQVHGNGTSFAPSVLAIPGNPEVGISFLKDSVKLAINTWIDFDASSKPLLQAVLVTQSSSGNRINYGAFSASATLVVDYR